MDVIINGIELRAFDETYYVSKNGDVYSTYSNKFLKHSIDHDGYHRVDIHSKHMKVHRLVYMTWVENNKDIQVNHIDDNKDNNSLNNLYAGTQKENISDCIRNGNRAGHIGHITVLDKLTNEILTFSPMSDFIQYCGHQSKSGSVKKFFNKNWFKKRFDIIDYNPHSKV